METLFDPTLGVPVVVAAAALAALIDWRTGHIPNWLTLGALGLGVLVLPLYRMAAEGGHWRGWALAFFGVIVCALVPLLLHRAGAMGGGDVKLLAAVGALYGPSLGLRAELYAFAAAALWAPAVLTFRGELLRALKNAAVLAFNACLPKARRRALDPLSLTELRFGPAICVGVLTTALLEVQP